MNQFYIINDRESDLRACEKSRNDQTRITVIGTTPDGQFGTFTGTVQTVECNWKAFIGKAFPASDFASQCEIENEDYVNRSANDVMRIALSHQVICSREFGIEHAIHRAD